MTFKNYSSKAFTLIEICIVIIITGLLLVSIMQVLEVYQKKERIEKTVKNIQIVEKSLQTFLGIHGYYPCPALLDARSGDATFGISQNCATLTGDVVTGAVPTTTPNPKFGQPNEPEFITVVPFTNTIDGYGNRITYALTRRMGINEANYEDPTTVARVDVQLLDETRTVTERFLLISHGADAKGAFSSGGVRVSDCTGSSQNDAENCDNDPVFSLTELNRATVDDNSHFDDFLSLRTTVGTTYSCDGSANQVMIGFIDDQPICRVAPEVDSLCSPEDRQRLIGYNSQGEPVCRPLVNNQNCPNGQVARGINPDGSPICSGGVIQCPTGQVLAGIDLAGNRVCVSRVSCPAGQIENGVRANGTPNCVPIASILPRPNINVTCRVVEHPTQNGTNYTRPNMCGPNEFMAGGGARCSVPGNGAVGGYMAGSAPTNRNTWFADCAAAIHTIQIHAICCRVDFAWP